MTISGKVVPKGYPGTATGRLYATLVSQVCLLNTKRRLHAPTILVHANQPYVISATHRFHCIPDAGLSLSGTVARVNEQCLGGTAVPFKWNSLVISGHKG